MKQPIEISFWEMTKTLPWATFLVCFFCTLYYCFNGECDFIRNTLNSTFRRPAKPETVMDDEACMRFLRKLNTGEMSSPFEKASASHCVDASRSSSLMALLSPENWRFVYDSLRLDLEAFSTSWSRKALSFLDRHKLCCPSFFEWKSFCRVLETCPICHSLPTVLFYTEWFP